MGVRIVYICKRYDHLARCASSGPSLKPSELTIQAFGGKLWQFKLVVVSLNLVLSCG